MPIMKVKTADGSWQKIAGANLGGAAPQIPGDWAQSDVNAPDYIKNRTHYAGEKTELTIFDEEIFLMKLPYVDWDDSVNFPFREAYEDYPDLVYHIAFDGQIYDSKLTYMYYYPQDSYIAILGNASILGFNVEDNGIPCALMFNLGYSGSNSWADLAVITKEPISSILTLTVTPPAEEIPEGEVADDEVIIDAWEIDCLATPDEEDWYDYGYELYPMKNLIEEVGKEYTIIFDGEEYKLISEVSDDGNYYLGDYFAESPATMKYPFFIIANYYDEYEVIYVREIGKTHTIEINTSEYAAPATILPLNNYEFVPTTFPMADMPSYLFGYRAVEHLGNFFHKAPVNVTFDGLTEPAVVMSDEGITLYGPAQKEDEEPNPIGLSLNSDYIVMNGEGMNTVISMKASVTVQLDEVLEDNSYLNIIPEQLIDVSLGIGNVPAYTTVLEDFDFVLKEDTLYRVKWNGREYFPRARLIDNVIMMGNNAPLNGKTEMPFNFSYSEDDEFVMMAYLPADEDKQTHQVGIEAYKSSLKKLDAKYLPIATATQAGAVKAIPGYHSHSRVVYADETGLLTSALPETRVTDGTNNVYLNDEYNVLRFKSENDSVHVKNENGDCVVTIDSVASWNDLTDKPFEVTGDLTVVEWDGVIGSQDKVVMGEDPASTTAPVLVKVSSLMPTAEEIKTLQTVKMSQNGEIVTQAAADFPENWWENSQFFTIFNDGISYVLSDSLIVAHNTELTTGEGDSLNTITVPSTGIYFMHGRETIPMIVLGITYGTQEITYLDEKFIPDSIARVSDVEKAFSAMDNDFDEMASQVEANTNAINALTNGADPDTIDGVNDLIQYVAEHGTEVTGMKEDIKANADAIAAIPEAIPVPATAAVGQMIVVKAIDENGKPTEWEVVDVPSAPVTSVNGLTGEVQLTIPEVKEYTVNGVTADESGNITIDIPVVKNITVNNVAADENGNISIDIPEAFSGNYNDLTNKPVAAAVADAASENVTAAEFNALLAALRAAGLLEASASE